MANTQSSFNSRMTLLLIWISILLMFDVLEVGCQVTIPGVYVKNTSACYTAPVIASCPDSQIAITSAYHGFYDTGTTCDSETVPTDGCQQHDTSSTYRDALSGTSSGYLSCSNAVKDSCTSQLTSSYCQLSYQCIPRAKTNEMCVDGSINSSDGQAVFLHNREYATIGILSTDTLCSCSVEISSYSNIDIYIIDQELKEDVNNCKQTINIANRTDNLETFLCEEPSYNFIRKVTIPGTYITISLVNNKTETDGKFWYGFRASDGTGGITIDCPAKSQTLYHNCPVLQNTTSVTVTTDGIDYGSTATYTCLNAYVQHSGDQNVTCQKDGTWSGTTLQCIYDCQQPEVPNEGYVNLEGTNPGHQATYKCHDGYSMDGLAARTCIGGIGWNGTVPECKKATVGQLLMTILPLACGGVVVPVSICVIVAFIRARKAFHSENIRDDEITEHPPGPAAESDIQIQMVENPENVYHTKDDNANEYETLPPGRTTHENVYHTIDDNANEYETLPPERTTHENVYTSLN